MAESAYSKHQVENVAEIFEEYRATGAPELKNILIMHYSYIAKSVAVQTRGITGNYAQVDDIVNEGIVTLMDCLDKFTQDKGMKFENYAYMRIKNAVVDFVRKQDWVPRRVRRTARELNMAYHELATKYMREPTNKELAEHMGITEDAVRKHLAESASGLVLSFEELVQDGMPGVKTEPLSLLSASGDAALPEQGLMKTEMREQLAKSIEALTEKERLVISLYYYEHLKLHEIATIMGVSESRVSQTHSKAIMKMKQYLASYVNE